MILFTDKIDRTGNYSIDDEKGALKLINTLFSRRPMSKEIAGYLREIIQNDQITDKSVLSERLRKFLPGLLDIEFVERNEFSIDKNVILGAFSNFIGYWLLLSSTDQKKNHIPVDSKDKFAFFCDFLQMNIPE